MANREFSSIVNRVEALVPQAPRPTVLEHIRLAARAACEKTLSWRYMPATFALLPGVHEYAFNVPTDAELEHLYGVSVNDCPLVLANLDVAIARYPEWADLFSGEDAEEVWSETPGGYIGAPEYNEELFNGGGTFVLPDSIVAEASRPAMCTMISQQRYVILPLPDGEETYTTRMWMALKPTRTATGMDEQAFNELEDLFVWGALETLFSMPGKTWTNPDYSVHYGNKFREGYLEKRRRVNIGHVRGPMSARSVRWL
jgi:hypothetical protein